MQASWWSWVTRAGYWSWGGDEVRKAAGGGQTQRLLERLKASQDEDHRTDQAELVGSPPSSHPGSASAPFSRSRASPPGLTHTHTGHPPRRQPSLASSLLPQSLYRSWQRPQIPLRTPETAMVRHKEMRETTILTSAALEGVSLSVERSSLYARSLAISLRWTEGSHQNASAFLECPYWTAQSPPRRRYRHRPCCPKMLVYPDQAPKISAAKVIARATAPTVRNPKPTHTHFARSDASRSPYSSCSALSWINRSSTVAASILQSAN